VQFDDITIGDGMVMPHLASLDLVASPKTSVL
jgi:hypothetical protein